MSGKPVQTDVWHDVHEVPHVRLGQQTDLVVVAPATADLIARAAHGRADDLLTATLLTARCPVVMAPAMHTEMWEHPATQANVATLAARGIHIVPPASGRLTGADTGPGRLPEPADLYDACLAVARASTPLQGMRVVISAGGTREPLDPVRFLGNRSSGKQGYALAAVAAERGADVTLVSANVALPVPAGVALVTVGTALQMQAAVTERAGSADVIVMAAAVADFRPRTYAPAKIKKSHRREAGSPAGGEPAPTVELVRNPDILAGLVQARGAAHRPLIVGFAAETGDSEGSVLDHARAKLERKGADLVVANEVGETRTFGQDSNEVSILRRSRPEVTHVGQAPKERIAGAVWDAIQDALGVAGPTGASG
ncbi:MAG TPA: bifunctional phosphopantothenoylcysteine decarboxylase/phosphopantothenate--cysteine ligase CoaBC [Candidatus Lustribacter sp.]|nr:bifunctional phosphopantothenoylcysteine decarboxylase/phosphopantothenate--cysteine ligase CoaBC [Candidatus Lustribacter sp.]